MGMKQKRCPICRKLRPYNQGKSTNDSRRRGERWILVNEKMVCAHCAKQPK